MGSSREESPDWLRCFQAPTQSVLTLSSGSESASPNDSPLRDTEPKEDGQDVPISDRGEESPLDKPLKGKSPSKLPKAKNTPAKKRKTDIHRSAGGGKSVKQEKSAKRAETNAPDNSVWTLSSDSESPHYSPIREASIGKSPKKRVKTEDPVLPKKKKANSGIDKKGNDGDVEVAKEEIAEKHIEPHFSSSRLPLVLSEKVNRSKALVECEGESIDLSGDVGAVGRVVVSDNPSGNQEVFFDLKGTIYKTTIVPSRTFCVVSFGQSEAKIEAIMNDFIQLTPQSNVYEAETMVEGTLDGFLFDSEDDADKVPKTVPDQTDQNEGGGEQSNKKRKTKSEKTSGVVRKRGKAAGGKPPPKKAKKKTQAVKKSKTKK
ncbi:DNA-binding protein [Actinidia chinensis var. chinensis]|uniref:DNA-binding protein n=1 Tax=Actinidia chinensis var. chinensis TaxID=1590841 RepID=A0A2R6Q9E3_ACTCC|nr:DNA-binding protein [Actinidia chinensis var. chinensis]